LSIDMTSAEAQAIMHAVIADGADDQQYWPQPSWLQRNWGYCGFAPDAGECWLLLNPSHEAELKRLVALERYERHAYTRRRRVSAKLRSF
jgi:hypothetical protein